MKRFRLLICSITVLLVMYSCKKDNGFGSELLPNENALDLQYEESYDITTSTKFEDPLRTDRMLFNYLGYLEHPLFGSSTGSVAVQYGLPTELDLTLAPFTVESVQMYTFYDNHFGDTTAPVSLTVHPLTKAVNTSKIYKNNEMIPFESNAIGSIQDYYFTPNTPQKLRDNDTITSKGFFKIQLDNSYGEAVKNLLETGLITNDTLFFNRFPGLYLQPSLSQLGKTMVQLDLTHLSGGVYIYLKDKKGANQIFILPFSTTSFNHNTILHDYAGTLVESAVNSGENPLDEKLYLQTQAGTKVQVQLNDIEKYKGKIINKAILEVYEVEKPLTGYLRALNIYPLLKGQSGENVSLLDYAQNFYGPTYADTTLVGTDGQKLIKYNVNITNLMKDYVLGKKSFTSIYLANYPVFDDSPKFIVGDNAVLSQHIEPASVILGSAKYPNSEKRMRLKVWYTNSK